MKTPDRKYIFDTKENGRDPWLTSVWSIFKRPKQGKVGSKSNLLLIEQAKQEWEVTADSLPQFVCLFDRAGKIWRANRTVEQWGLGRVTGVKGLSLHDLFHPGCTDPVCYLTQFLYRAKEKLGQGQPTGCEAADPILDRYLNYQIYPISFQTSGRTARIASFGVVVVEDVTTRKATEAALHQAHAEVEQRVAERTADLANAVTALKKEIVERTQAEVENTRLVEQVQQGREQMRRLAQQTVSAQEAERQRLSRELHDEAGQSLTALMLTLNAICRDLPAENDPLRRQLDEATKLADGTMERLRTLAQDLRPPALDTAGLDPALESLCHDFASYTQLPVEYQGMPVSNIPNMADICLYRFLQEALTNVAKHAQASRVSVRLKVFDGQVLLSVEDNGCGFDQDTEPVGVRSPRGIGLLGLRERLELLGGKLELESQPGYGTRLTARLPREANQ